MAPRDDLGALYAKRMEHFGCGVAMFQPVAAADMRAPCVGYLDDNLRWNFIANIEWLGEAATQDEKIDPEYDFNLLERAPRKLEQLGIEWRPRTSIGVRQLTVDANGQTPSTGLPVGAEGHIKYVSKGKFGAVLIARKPITLTSYNDETLFQSWLLANKSRLSSLYGTELRRYGLRIVTRTYTCPGCSINAWHSKDREATMTVKAKADMLGELGADLDWTQRLIDKDWSHYFGRNPGDTVVVFFDGIEVPASTWRWEGLKGRFAKEDVSRRGSQASPCPFRAHSQERQSSPLRSPRDMARGPPADEDRLLNEADLWGSSAPLRRASSVNSRSTSRGRQASNNRNRQMTRSMSTPRRLSRYIDYDQRSSTANDQARHISILEPPNQCLSPASMASSLASVRVRKPVTADVQISPDESRPKGELRRKTKSPLLRPPPRKHVNWGNDRSTI